MKQKCSTCILLAGMGMILSFSLACLSAPSRPNVIFILMDDMGYSDVSYYGATKVKTPNIDRMAGEGLRFTDFHTAASICSPSRAAFLTGAYPQRCGPYMGINRNREAHWFLGLKPDEITIAELFKKQDYTTAMIGKWHLGSEEEFSYFHQGFDHYYGAPENVGHDPKFLDGRKVIYAHAPLDRLTTLYTERIVRHIGEFNVRGSEQRPTGTLFPEVPILSNQAQDWDPLSDEEKGRGKKQFKGAHSAKKRPRRKKN